MKNKDNFFWGVYIIIILILLGIGIYYNVYIKTSALIINDTDGLVCIAKNSHLYIATGCGYCATQLKLLGENSSSVLNITNCRDNPMDCTEVDIQAVPTWIINGESYLGLMQINQLKNLTGCK